MLMGEEGLIVYLLLTKYFSCFLTVFQSQNFIIKRLHETLFVNYIYIYVYVCVYMHIHISTLISKRRSHKQYYTIIFIF